jgi:Protein of unknown function (DUF2723)
MNAARAPLGLAAFAAPLLLYAITAHRFVGFWDVGEMDTVPYILGIAHPPGLPLYTLAGWLFSHGFPLGSVAFRMSFFSGVCISLAAWCVYAIVRELQGDPISAVLAAWLFAVGGIAWTVATRADVHAFATALYVLALLMMLRWYREPVRKRLNFAALAFGLAIAAHPVGLFLLPAILMLVIAKLHETDGRTFFGASLIAFLAATVWFLYLPLRSAYVTAAHLDPVAQLGFIGNAFWDYDHPMVLQNFAGLVFAQDVDVTRALHGYGEDAFVDSIAGFALLAMRDLTPLGVAAALIGIVRAWYEREVRVAALCIAGITPALFALGFRDESDASRYFLPAFAALCAIGGYGLSGLRPRKLCIPAQAALFAAAAFLLMTQPTISGQADDRRALDQADEVLRTTPDDAIIVASWTLAPPLAYRAYVDRAAGRRIIVPAWFGETADRLDAWSRRRRVFVVGTPEGSVRGFRLERLSAQPELYRVEPIAAQL